MKNDGSFRSAAENNVSSGKIFRFSTRKIDVSRSISPLLLELHPYCVKMHRREGMKNRKSGGSSKIVRLLVSI